MDSDIKFSQSYLSGRIYYQIDEVDSTNYFLENLMKDTENAQETLVRADYQKIGKGNQNTTWESEKGKNLLFSTVIFPQELAINKQFFLSKCVSLSIHDLISKYVSQEDVKIKWPNDVLIGSEKISGTLIKGSVKNGQLSQNIIGIGLNVNQETFSKSLKATSLKKILGKEFDIESILKDLLQCLDGRLKELNKKKYAKINMDYHQKLLSFRSWKSYVSNGNEFRGRILEVCDDGRVLIETENGQLNKFELKEISLNRDF